MEICTNVDQLAWEPHPLAKGVEIKPLFTTGIVLLFMAD